MNINYDYSGIHGNMSARNSSIKYVVIHYTGSMASARNNCIYFAREGASTNASADFFIDRDGEIYQYNGNIDSYKSWHCGGGTSYGCTNSNSVGIECVSDGADFTSEQIDSLRELVGQLMSNYGIPASHVIRHYDCNSIRKNCPAPYINADKWNALHSVITGGEYVPAPEPEHDDDELVVDGVLGHLSIKLLQKLSGSPYHDGVLSGQVSACQKYHPSIIACTYERGGSESVRVIQRIVGIENVDGIWGHDTSIAVQGYLNRFGYGLAVDGVFGQLSAKALQMRLNSGAF